MAAVAPVEAYQNEWELDQMLAVVERLEPKTILEVGAMYGGTLWHWIKVASTVVVVDDEMRNADLWREWADEEAVSLELLRGYSYDSVIVNAAREHAPFDFIFIDADHSYEAVKNDWGNYGPMIAEGGIVAFHDTQHIGDPTYGVEQLWGEITQEPDVRWLHICMTHHCGIGLVFC